MADKEFHLEEDNFLRRVAEIFDIKPSVYERLRARHVDAERDPYTIVGVPLDVDIDALKHARRQFMRENHPDILVSKGLPVEMIAIGHRHVADFNAAFDTIMKDLQKDHEGTST
jgi:DnaJ like chaperone protein